MLAELGIAAAEEAVQTSIAQVWLRPDGIVCVVLKPHVRITVEHMAEVNVVLREIAGSDLRRPALTDISAPHETDPAVRRYGASEVTRGLTRCLALVVRTPVARMLGNAFLRARRPTFPVQLFTDHEAGIRWLQEFPG